MTRLDLGVADGGCDFLCTPLALGPTRGPLLGSNTQQAQLARCCFAWPAMQLCNITFYITQVTDTDVSAFAAIQGAVSPASM